MNSLRKKGLLNWAAELSLALCAGALSFVLSGLPHGSAAQSEAGVAPTYTDHVEPLLKAKCLACHNGETKLGGLVMESYEALLKGGAHGPVFSPGHASDSRMVLMLKGNLKPQMPFAGDPLRPAEIALVEAWINAGAKGPAAGATSTTTAPKPVIPNIKPSVPVVAPVASLAFSPDGKLLAVGGYKEVRVFEAASGKTLATLSGHLDEVRALAFDPAGKWLAAAGGLPARLGEIKIWEVQSGRLLRTMTGHADCVYSLAASPDGKLLASSSYDKLIKLWDVKTGKELRTLKDHIDSVFAVAFSPDGKRLASGAADRTVKVWDVASGQRLFTLSEPIDGVTTVAFHPSGDQVAAAGYDKMIRVWNLAEKGGSLAQSAFAHEDVILRIVYSPDGKYIISTSADRTIKVWDSATLGPVKVLEKQTDWVEAMSISPDGKWLAAGRYDGTLSVYELGSYQRVLGPLLASEVFKPPTHEGGESVAAPGAAKSPL